MKGSKYVPLAVLACAALACEQPPAAPDYENVSDASLALCAPAPERKYTVSVGVEGGRFSAPGALLAVPAGAVAQTTTFTIRIPGSGLAEIDVKANGQNSFTFQRPVTIGIDYSACGTTLGGRMTVWHIDTQTKGFLEDMGGVNDVANQRVIFSTMHLSGYAIAN